MVSWAGQLYSWPFRVSGRSNLVQFTTQRLDPLVGDFGSKNHTEVAMTLSNQSLSEPDFYLQVEDFILNASTNSNLDNATENEIRLFLFDVIESL